MEAGAVHFKENCHRIYSGLIFRNSNRSDEEIFAEIYSLRTFVEHCDTTGLSIPNDSPEFRNKYLNPQKMMDDFIFHRRKWPSPEYFDIMAVAQHHGLPTRLLDWTRRSYVAAYFAASDALRRSFDNQQCTTNKSEDKPIRLAVWALHLLDRMGDIEIIRVPGSNNANLANQSGLFTLLRQEYERGQPFQSPECLDDYATTSQVCHLAKVTAPASEATKVLDLCERHGITAATLHPDYYGSARATLDYFDRWSKSERTDGRDVQAKTLPVHSALETEEPKL
jgi:FRG domain